MVVKVLLIHMSSDHCIFLLSNLVSNLVVFFSNLVSVGIGSHDIILVAVGVESTSSMTHSWTIAILISELLVIKWVLLVEVLVHRLIVAPSV